MTRRTVISRLRGRDHTAVLGVMTLVLITVIVYLSYIAGSGLPFLPTYRLFVDVPSSAQLVKHADVRIGGARVGQVVGIQALPRDGDQPPRARLEIIVKKDLEPLPSDTSAEVRVGSVLGGKYLSLVPGRSRSRIEDGGVLSIERSKVSVDLDEGFRVFDRQTRENLQTAVKALGDAGAGRGRAVNDAIARTRRLLPPLERTLATLADPRTDLRGFVRGAAGTTSALEPVSPQLRGTIEGGATTFEALEAAGGSVDGSISELPRLESVATTVLLNAERNLAAPVRLARALRKAAPELPAAARELSLITRAATPVVRRGPRLATPLRQTLRAIDEFAGEPAAAGLLRVLGGNDLATIGASALLGLGGIFQTLAPAQLHCNSIAIWMRNLASASSEGDVDGAWVRVLPIFNSGQSLHQATPSGDLHHNPYPVADERGCEAGNEPYAAGRAIGRPFGVTSRKVPSTRAPAEARRRAKAAGLLEAAR